MPVDTETNEWLHDGFGALDTRDGDPGESLAEHVARLAAEALANEGEETPAHPAEIAVVIPATPAAEAEPKVFRDPDGSEVTIEKTSKGWKGTLDDGKGGRPEVFYGATKDDMWVAVGRAKIHANTKIREQNRKIRLGAPNSASEPIQVAPVSKKKDLTADDRASIQALMTSDPAAALDKMFELRYGVTPDVLAAKAERGDGAARDLYMEQQAREFATAHPDYHAVAENYEALIGLLAKEKLGKTLNANNGDKIIVELYDRGFYSAENLGAAYDDLNDDGLLIQAPQTRTAAPVLPAIPVTPAGNTPATPPAVPSTPAQRVERRPRAGFGLRASEATAFAPEPTTSLSAYELDQMSESEVTDLFAKVRAEKLRQRRS